MNIQFAIKDGDVYILEVNPRASRTVPFVAKATGLPVAKVAAKVMAGKTLAELGVAGYDLDVWFGLFAPAKTPADIVAKLGAEARKYMSSPEAKEAYAKAGHEPLPSSGEAMRARIVAEQKIFAKAVKDAGVKPE